MHDAAVLPLSFEAVLMDEEAEGAFHNFIFEQIRVAHRFPAACPAHRDDPPIAAMQLDQASFFRESIRFQTDQPQGWRHDQREIGWIAMKSEHGFRTGSQWGAGVENRGHGWVFVTSEWFCPCGRHRCNTGRSPNRAPTFCATQSAVGSAGRSFPAGSAFLFHSWDFDRIRSSALCLIPDFRPAHRHPIDEDKPFFEIENAVTTCFFTTILADEDEYLPRFTRTEAELSADGMGLSVGESQGSGNPMSSFRHIDDFQIAFFDLPAIHGKGLGEFLSR